MHIIYEESEVLLSNYLAMISLIITDVEKEKS